MSTQEECTQMGQTSCPSVSEDTGTHSDHIAEEDKLGDNTKAGADRSAILTEDAGHDSVHEPTIDCPVAAQKPCTNMRYTKENDPHGPEWLVNFFTDLWALEKEYPEEDHDDQKEPNESPGVIVRPKSWAEKSSGNASEDGTEENRTKGPTHSGQPWESDSDDDSDSESDDEEYVSAKYYGKIIPASSDSSIAKSIEKATHEIVARKAVTYKTRFGRIVLDAPQSPAVMIDSCSEMEQTRQDTASTPPVHDRVTLDEAQKLAAMDTNLPEAKQSYHHSVTAPIGPIAEPESFRNHLYEVKQSVTAGYGAFALQKLVKGQTILIEKSLFLAVKDTLRDELDKLKPELLEAFDRMHGHGFEDFNDVLLRHTAKFKTNSFMINRRDHGVFMTASKFNHACKPKNNVAYMYDKRHDCMVFTVSSDIEAGAELFITYGKDPEDLYKHYGFVCRCGGCNSLTEKQVEDILNPRW